MVKSAKSFSDHIVVLILAESNDPLTNILNLITNIATQSRDNIKIVVLGESEYLRRLYDVRRNWERLQSDLHVLTMGGDPFNTDDLSSAGLDNASCCIIISANDCTESTVAETTQILAANFVRSFLLTRGQATNKYIPVITEISKNLVFNRNENQYTVNKN